jgi:glycine dehydrogenase subunit 1
VRYLPHTAEEIRAMLDAAGRGSIDELFETIPPEGRFQGRLAIPEALSEPRLMRHLSALEGRNTAARMLSFLGGGMYDHHIPPAVDQLLLRSEFYTAYTPYQPEVAQGTLLAIWEFQTMVSELYGLPLANASLYDGASAAAEAVLMARRLTRRGRVVVSECVHPHYRETIRSYLAGSGSGLTSSFPVSAEGTADESRLLEAVDVDTACVVIGYPSWLGPLAAHSALAEAVHARGALLVVVVVEPYALALAEPPGAWGADIVVGEGQPLACPPQYGGPGVGLFACQGDRKFLQQLPGRVCGETVDRSGKRGFVLTLSTREQHIRRERATSNICTNQGLIALSMTIRMALLGRSGFVATAEQCLAKAHYLRGALLDVPGVTAAFGGARFFNEFALRIAPERGGARGLLQRLEQRGILGGVPLGDLEPALDDCLSVAVTERHTREDLDRLVAAFRE